MGFMDIVRMTIILGATLGALFWFFYLHVAVQDAHQRILEDEKRNENGRRGIDNVLADIREQLVFTGALQSRIVQLELTIRDLKDKQKQNPKDVSQEAINKLIGV